MRKPWLFSLALSSLVPLCIGCTTVTDDRSTLGEQKSWTDKVGDSFKGGTAKLTALVTPKAKQVADNSGPKGTPGPNVFVAMGHASEESGNIEDAETQYRKALAIDPNHLGALTAYAHLEDRRNNFEAATNYYLKALKKNPKEAAVHNDLGLCYHRRGMLNEATRSLAIAVELQPQRKLYRDNLAAVLVEQGKPAEALPHLTAAHGEAVGNYNLGYLLFQRNERAKALAHFQKAVQLDPTLAPARQWVAQLSSPMTGSIRETSHLARMVVVGTGPEEQPKPVSQPVTVAAAVDSGQPAIQTVAGEEPTGELVRLPVITPGVQLPPARPASESTGEVAPLPDAPGDGRLPEVASPKG